MCGLGGGGTGVQRGQRGGCRLGAFDQLENKGPKWLQINLGRPKL